MVVRLPSKSNMSRPQIHVVGGVYFERCFSPDWGRYFGSAGRAAAAIGTLALDVTLHGYMSDEALEGIQTEVSLMTNVTIRPIHCDEVLRFRYLHDLATPDILGLSGSSLPPISVSEPRVLRFGMLESNANVQAEWAVYDPQNQGSTEPFALNGSKADHLALVLNLVEARKMSGLGQGTAEECASSLLQTQGAEVVVIKMGPNGALVGHGSEMHRVPAFRSNSVWKIGSGDVFAATFAAHWMGYGRSPKDAAEYASRATALYCGTRGFASHEAVQGATMAPITPSWRLAGRKPKVYLAGPFFDLAQLWMVDQARLNLQEVGMDVFSPFHDIGLGTAHDVAAKDLIALNDCDLVFAIVDGADTGTVFEVGYAVAKDKPVIAFSQRESEESLKMLTGTNCMVCNDYATAIYKTLWKAVEL